MRRTFWLAALVLLAAPAAAASAADELKPGEVLHLTVEKYHRPWSLYVPSSYNPRVSWPLVISSHGLNGSGKGEIGAWVGLAKEHGFLVACPDMCSATEGRPPATEMSKWDEDDAVLMEIVDTIRAHFRVNPRAVMITGFSGGGNPSYYSGLRHPDVFTHICTRGGNFAPFQLPKDEKVLEEGKKNLVIYIFYGDHDHPLILGQNGEPGQAVQAYEALKAAGYEHLTIEKVEGMKHESRPGKAADWFGAFLKENEKLFRAGDEADELMADAKEEIAKEDWRGAIRALDKLEKHEEKHGLRPRAAAEKEKIDAVGRKQIEEATKLHDAGDTGEALKILGRVIRDFRGLPSADRAKDLKKEWQP